MADKFLNLTGLSYIWTKITSALNLKADKTELPSEATDNDLGLIKTNSPMSIYLDENGNLVVGGRLGQFPTSLGLFAPDDREPRSVSDYSLLITDAKGMTLGNRALAVVSGLGVTCKSAPAGSTEYRVSNTYANRLLCKIAENGYASRDEATSKVEMTIPVVSVTIDGSSYTPDSSANDRSKDIIIKTETTLNPDSAVTSIRLFPVMNCYSTVHVGNGIASWAGGRNFLLGGGVVKDGSGNDNCVVSNGAYVSGNGNAVFGRHHIVRKNRGFFAGQGHDNTNATGEGVSAIGQYSNITANTMFAIGNGSNHTTRLNLLEVLKDGRVKISGTPTEDDDVATKKYVDDNAGGGGGEPTLTTYGNADFTYEKVLDPDTQEVINECIAYSTSSGNANEPTATKYGRVVNLAGAFKNINARPDNTAFDMGKVPVGCEPLKPQYILSQGTSQYKFMLTIRTDGTINCSRYSTGASAVAVPNNAWLNINATYISSS